MKSHTGAVMTMGEGAASSMSTKQKLNTKSSTEAEVVGVDDAMSNIVWTRNFLLAQGIQIADNVIYQDNQSAILLERNGRRSSGKRTRHIDIRYFFITDRIAKKEVRVEHCPTKDMLADMFTKPLQGALFRKLRNRVLNIKDSTAWVNIHNSELQECVGSRQVSRHHSGKKDGQTYMSDENNSGANEWVLVKRKKSKPSQPTIRAAPLRKVKDDPLSACGRSHNSLVI